MKLCINSIGWPIFQLHTVGSHTGGDGTSDGVLARASLGASASAL